MTLRIEPGNSPKWWVDSSYAMHLDMKSHTGIYMTIGQGGTYTASCKQKINTKSSTEAELVAIDDTMAQVLLTRNFLAAQGEPVTVTTIYQDNKSTRLLSENGKGSSSKRTKHLDIRYFFYNRSNKARRSKSGNLPNQEYASGFFYKTSSRFGVQAYAQHHT